MHIANFDPATADGSGFPVELQGLGYSLTTRVSPQFFGLQELKTEVANAKVTDLIMQPKVGGLVLGGVALGLFGGFLLGKRAASRLSGW